MPEKMYVCLCGRNYVYRASLYNHRKKCETVKLENSKNTTQNAYPGGTYYGVSHPDNHIIFSIEEIVVEDDGDRDDSDRDDSDRDGEDNEHHDGDGDGDGDGNGTDMDNWDATRSVTNDKHVEDEDDDTDHIHINISMGSSPVVSVSGTSIVGESGSSSVGESVSSSVVSGVRMNAAYLEHLNALKEEREKIRSVSTDISTSSSSTDIASSSSSSSPPQMMGIITTLMEQNQRLQELIIEQARKSNEREERLLELASRPTTTNINNPRVNILNVLNTEYKEAMDISQFLDSIEVSLEDMFYTRDKGYVEGLCNVFVKQIENLNIHERPIHCADRKRLKFFVKTDNKWTRDDANKFISRAMSDISEKHVNTLAEWKRLHPNWMDVEELRDEYIQITRAIIGESTPDKEEKARRAFAKNISASTEFKHLLKG